MTFDSVTYTTKPSRDSNGPYITVYAPDGSYVSRHVNMEECTESALAHAEAEGIEGVYRFVPPEKHMAVRRRTVILPSGTTITESAQPGAGSIPVSGGQPSLSFETPGNLDVPGTFFLDSSAPGGGDGTSPATAWNSVAQARARTWQTSDRLYLERSGYYDFGNSTFTLWSGTEANPAWFGAYYMDGGIPVDAKTGSNPSAGPQANDNGSLSGLPHIDNGPSNGFILTADNQTWLTIDSIRSDGDLNTNAAHGWNATGLDVDPTSSVDQHITIAGTASNITVQNCHLENAAGWGGVEIGGSASFIRILDNKGGNHGWWRSTSNPIQSQRDVGNFLQILENTSNILVQGNSFKGAGHSLLNNEGSSTIIRFNTLDGEVGTVGSLGLGSKALEIRTNFDASTVLVEANLIINTAVAIDGEPSAIKSRGDDNIWRYNRFQANADSQFSITSSAEHRTSDDQVFYNNEFTNYGVGNQQFGAVLYLSDGGSPIDFHASRGFFVNNGVDDNLATTNPRFMQWNDSMDIDPGESNIWNGWFIGSNRFVEANPEARYAGQGSTSLVTRESQYPNNFASNDFGVTGLTATSGGQHVATITSNTGSGTSFTVDRPQSLRDGGGLIGGDVVRIGSTEHTITDITGSTVTVTPSATWTQGDGVSPAAIMNGSVVRQGIPASITPGATETTVSGTLAPIISESHWVLGGSVNNNDVAWLNGISDANLEPFDCVVKRYYWGQHETAGSGTASGSFDFTDMDAMVAAVAARGKYFQVLLQWKHSNPSIGDIVPSDLTAFQFSVDGGQCAMMYNNTVRTRFQQWCIAVIDRYAGNATFAGIQTNETSGMGAGAGYVQSDYISQIRSLYINLLNRNASKYVGIGWNFIPGANNLAAAQTAFTTLFGGAAFETRPNLYFWTPDIVRDDPDSDNSFTALNDRTFPLFDPAYSGVTFTPINRHPCGSSMQFASYTLPDSATAANSDTVNNGGYDSDELFTWARTNLNIPFCIWTYQNTRDYTFDSPTSGNIYGDAVGVARLNWGHAYNSSYAIGVPYTPEGTIPSGWASLINWPTAPTVGSPVTVSTAGELSSALTSGAHIRLNGDPLSPTDYGTLFITGATSNVRLEAVNPGGASFGPGSRIDGDLIRLDGIRVDGWFDLTQGPTDFLAYNCLFNQVDPGVEPPNSVFIGSFFRAAFINCTVIADGDMFAFLYAGSTQATDFILANCFVYCPAGAANNDPHRIGHTTRMIYLDNWFQSVGSANQFRAHNDIEDILKSNNIYIEGATKQFIDRWGDGSVPGSQFARRFYAIENRYYDQNLGSGSTGPFTAMSQNGGVLDAEAVDNTHYSDDEGGSSMDQGSTSWVTFTNNAVAAFQSPPARTQGANFNGTSVVNAYPPTISGGSPTYTANVTAVGSGNSIVIATWSLATLGAPTVTDSAGGTYTLDFTGPSQEGFVTRYYRRANITNAPTTVTVEHDEGVADFFTGILELDGEVTPELTISGNSVGSSLTLSGAGTTFGAVGLGHMSLGVGRTMQIDTGWVRFSQDADPGAVVMLYQSGLPESVQWTNEVSSATTMYGTLVTYRQV